MSLALAHGYLPSEKYIINHDIMHCTADGVHGNHLYGSRSLGISEPYDKIQLRPELADLWDDIKGHYERIGLTFTQDVIWNVDMDQIGRHINHHPSVFYFGPHECIQWGDYEWLGTVEYINSKNNFIEVANQLGVKTPPTTCYENINEIDESQIERITFPCYLKAAVSVSGVGIYRCSSKEELLKAIENFTDGTPVQIQAEVKSKSFLNLQYRVIDGYPVRLACTEQLLDGFAHQGNRHPARYEPWEAVETMAYWLTERGMKGVFAFDVGVVETAGSVTFPVVECNPRFNGASYPTIIAQKLDIPEWSARAYTTSHRSLADIDISDLEFNKKTGKGVVIVNWGTVLVGKVTFLLAGNELYQEKLAEKLKSRL